MSTLKRGTWFESRHWLNPADKSPLVCRVTKISAGTLYYRPVYGLHDDGTLWLGSPVCFPVEHFEKRGRVVSPPAWAAGK